MYSGVFIHSFTTCWFNGLGILIDLLDTNGLTSAQRMATTMSFDNSEREFTITPTGDDFYYYEAGIKHIKTGAQSVVIDDTEGIHAIYFDEDTYSNHHCDRSLHLMGKEIQAASYGEISLPDGNEVPLK